MAIIHQYNKKTGQTYVFESISYYDPAKKQSRSHRRLIGKIDPSTGEVVPTGKRGRPRKNAPVQSTEAQAEGAMSADSGSTQGKKKLQATVDAQKAEIQTLKVEVRKLSNLISQYEATFGTIARLAEKRSIYEHEPLNKDMP